ncbi:carbohydrate ABC transporter permease [Nonomuraea gerenzanensis]|uniref:N-Acetyl-D-glucosamine ABC transport system, permease protein 2 n=1 Tax=Nonomuraea gerenzanensis TaxID=93944 RepID=A0A1M4EGS8_9ACTN|nr:carbohydrate ABC transporter permease [Nonomuraea gerenzanensis]UBU09732.1 carbohydrate ABC transporter permease [Nonomuraea gerenzanensis]SBO98171.1 N-Acetyl-D-glucosamine ABC transport system, permease protein 2 [Nonomuraea gerenzanensis]
MAVAPVETITRAAPGRGGGTPSGRRRSGTGGRLLRLPFYLLSLTMVVPFYWLLITVFKPPSELARTPPSFVPHSPTVANFYDAQWSPERINPGHLQGIFQRFQVDFGFWRFLGNSLFITAVTTVGSLLICSLAAYVLAKHDIKGRRAIFLMVIASMMVPWQTTLIPNYVIMRNLGWLDSYAAYIMPALAKAFVLFFLVQFLQSLPDELIQAARVDGAGEWRIWWQIVLPLLRPALAAMSIFIVLAEWNNFLWPLIIVQSDEMANLPVALARLNSYYAGPDHQGAIMAGGLLASVPTIVFFLLFQRYFVRGIALSGLKG